MGPAARGWWNRSCTRLRPQYDEMEVAQPMKSLRIAFLSAAVLAIVPAALGADFGVRAGRYSDAEEEFVGAEVVFDVGIVNVNPNIEYSLADDVTAGSANLDLLFELAPASSIAPYLGAGVGLSYLDDDFGNNETDLLGNVIGGLAFKGDFLTPYVQVKYFRLLEDEGGGDRDELAFTVGLRF